MTLERWDRVAVAIIVTAGLLVLAVTVGAGTARAVFGDEYNIMPINSGAGTVNVPALPDKDAQGNFVYDRFFWAGTCDRDAVAGLAPGTAIPGGVGDMPFSVSAIGQPVVNLPPPSTPKHCIDWQLNNAGTPTPTEMWNTPPQWRLAPVTQAGAHADGSTTFGFDTPPTKGNNDNIVAKLPPGFIADPNAVPKCSAEQLDAKPYQCPPESQVGVLNLRLTGEGLGGNGGRNSSYTSPVYNLEPRKGNVAELGLVSLTNYSPITARLVAKARTNGDFGASVFVGQLPNALSVHEQAITIWGVPWAAHNDIWRIPQGHTIDNVSGCGNQPGSNERDVIPASGLTPACQLHYQPSWGEIKPFVSLETDCNQSPVTRVLTDAYQFPGDWIPDGRVSSERPGFSNADPDESDPDWKRADSPAPPVTGCEKLPFAPDIAFDPGSSTAGAPAGLSVGLSIPQNNEPPFDPPAPGATSPAQVSQYVEAANDHWNSDEGLATAHLKDTVVTLPEGFSVNPSGATGLEACSDGQIGITGRQGARYTFNNGDPFNKDGGADGAECPDASKIGTARVETPLLDEPVVGEVVLGTPASTDPRSGEMLRLFVVVRDPERGLIAKIFGSSTADGNVGGGGTGRLFARFVENPELPFDDLQLEFRGGARGMLAMPQACGATGWSAAFTPWSSVGASVPVPDVVDGGSFAVSTGCGQRFVPELVAGTDNRRGGGSGTFSFRFWREDGEPWLAGLSAKLPKGLLADVSDVTLCTNAQANAGACPADSKIGIADAKAGAGEPFVLEEKGEVFLTEGYKGGPYGLAVKIRGVAGPFRGSMELSPVIVRQKIDVDRATAQVTAISDPFPLVHHGVPLRVREVSVVVNRAGFTYNPSSCAAKQIRGAFAAADGQAYERIVAFQATDCARLRFKPKLTMRLTGRNQMQTGQHPGVKARVTQKLGEAGIRRAVVRLPLSLALDPDNAQALCEFADGTKPDLENHCPKGSIVGRARAVSPLLKKPLAGNVYFVKNVRTDPRTGNQIRTLPMIVVALRGEIAVNLRGNSNVKNRKLVNTFARVPDAPVSRFDISIKGGKNGILAVTRTARSTIDLCKTKRAQTTEALMDAHNRKRRDQAVTLKTPCSKKARNGKGGKRKRQR